MKEKFFVSCALAIVFASSNAFAFFGTVNYDLYSFKTRGQTYSCKGCEKLLKVSFRVNKEQGFVLVQMEGNPTITLSSCRVVNDKNWDCSDQPELSGNKITKREISMNNGVYVVNAYAESLNGKVIDGNYMCAK